MSEFSNGINLVLASDDNYAKYLGVALFSIVENYNDSRILFLHILDNGISTDSKKRLKTTINKPGIELLFYDISGGFLADFPEVNHLSRTSYARLLIAELLPKDIKKIIYLDCDLVVLKDIAELYDQNLGSYSLGAVSDVMAKEILRIYFYPGLTNYFNAGVLLIDLEAWRQKNIKIRAGEFIKIHFKDLIRSDQDVLNCLFKDDWKILDSRFNLDLKRESFSAMPPVNTAVLHYSDRLKPGSYLFSGRSGVYYFKYLNKTPWKDSGFADRNLKNFFKKYYYLLKKESKRIIRPFLPQKLLDNYRRLLWLTYKVKK